MSPPRSSRYYVGVDGGGSTTRALIGNEDGTAWGYGEASGSNPHERGIPSARVELDRALSRAWSNLGKEPQAVAGAFFGIAGAGSLTRNEREALVESLQRAPGATVEVDHDIRIALAGGLTGRSGVALIAGTGSSGYGRNSEGQTAKAGGWGALIDDVGGGYWLGLQALRAVARASDGRAGDTQLTGALLTQIGAEKPAQLLEWLRRPDIGRPEIAQLAEIIFRCAKNGDSTAQAVLRHGADELALIARAIALALFPEANCDVVFCGGLSQVSEYKTAVADALTLLKPTLRFVAAEHSPLVGALILATTQAGQALPPEWATRAEAAAAASRPR